MHYLLNQWQREQALFFTHARGSLIWLVVVRQKPKLKAGYKCVWQCAHSLQHKLEEIFLQLWVMTRIFHIG